MGDLKIFGSNVGITNSNYSFQNGHHTSLIKHVSWASYDFPYARASTSPESLVGLIHLRAVKPFQC